MIPNLYNYAPTREIQQTLGVRSIITLNVTIITSGDTIITLGGTIIVEEMTIIAEK